MARVNYTARHVRSLSELPAKLTIGRVYFVDDEGYLIVDHGAGPVIYANRTGPQGMPGEPIPELQAQIDYLTETAFKNIFNNYEENRERDEKLLTEIRERKESVSVIQNEIEELSRAVINLSKVVKDLSQNLQGTENTLLKLLMDNEQNSPITPLSQVDSVTIGESTWNITKAEDGTLIFIKEY